MPDDEKSSYSTLYDLLFAAGYNDAHMIDGHDPRREPFKKLVALMDQALGGTTAVYATHTFEGSFDLNAQLKGTAIAVTPTLIAVVNVIPGSALTVEVTALRSVTSVSVTPAQPAYFFGHPSWNGLAVRVHREGSVAPLSFPSVRSSMTNAHAFAAFYPTLLGALEAR